MKTSCRVIDDQQRQQWRVSKPNSKKKKAPAQKIISNNNNNGIAPGAIWWSASGSWRLRLDLVQGADTAATKYSLKTPNNIAEKILLPNSLQFMLQKPFPANNLSPTRERNYYWSRKLYTYVLHILSHIFTELSALALESGRTSSMRKKTRDRQSETHTQCIRLRFPQIPLSVWRDQGESWERRTHR